MPWSINAALRNGALRIAKTKMEYIVETLKGTKYEFAPNKYEGRYWNANGYACAVVASIGVEGAWAAYIGGCGPESEEEALQFVAAYGVKLTEEDARHFFPDLDLPYRD